MTPAEEQRRLQAHIARALQSAEWQSGAQRAGIYLRVSTKDQTAQNQVSSVVTMAAARGFVVAPEHVFFETGSGGDVDRPEVQRALLAAHRGRIRALFVWAIDRLSRDDTFAGGVREIGEFDRYNCAVVSHEESYVDTSGPMRNTIIQFQLRIAADERVRKGRRTREAMETRKKLIKERGGFWRKEKDGRPPKFVERFGRPSKHDPAARERALQVNAEQPGLTAGQIARLLCAESGGKWITPKETVRSWLEKEGRTVAKVPRYNTEATP